MIIRSLMLVTLMCVATMSQGATLTRSFTVVSINVYGDSDGDGDREYGGCMLRVNPDPASVLAGCGSLFVAPSCDGTYGTKSQAAEIMEQAKMAVITGRSITLNLDNTKKHGGRCYVDYAATVW